jgi:hypothetical protein
MTAHGIGKDRCGQEFVEPGESIGGAATRCDFRINAANKCIFNSTLRRPQSTFSIQGCVTLEWQDTIAESDAGGWRLAPHDLNSLVFRLKFWPDLPAQTRSVEMLRTLSAMDHRPLNRKWLLAHSKLEESQIDRLLELLIAEDAVELVDISQFAR